MNQIQKLPDRQPTMRLLARPNDTNAAGDIFGGWIMSQVDIAGSIEARRRAKNRVVTVAVNSFHFKKPVYVGDVISYYTEVEKIGKTSITVFVEVFAERNDTESEINVIKVTEATLTYVSVNQVGKPQLITQ